MFYKLPNYSNSRQVVKEGDYLIYEDTIGGTGQVNRTVYHFNNQDEIAVLDDYAEFVARSITANLKGTFSLVKWNDVLDIRTIREIILK